MIELSAFWLVVISMLAGIAVGIMLMISIFVFIVLWGARQRRIETVAAVDEFFHDARNGNGSGLSA
jgi:hypothetical protein